MFFFAMNSNFSRLVTTVWISFLLVGSGQELKPNPPKEKFSETHRFVFFAVIEGCFNDGVGQAEIDLMIPIRPERENRRSITKNLVYTCPLCSAVFDGLRLYSDRQGFISGMSKKEWYNTFGEGLDAKTKKALANEGEECRKAIQDLVHKWIETRIKKLRLNPKEGRALREKLAAMRDEGEKALKKFQDGEHGEELQKNYQAWKTCPVCAGVSPMKSGK